MIRSISAVVIGYLVFCMASVMTRLFWSSPDQLSVFASYGSVLGMIGAGYVAAFISRRAPLTHSFAVAVLSLIVSLVIGHLPHTFRIMTLGMLDSSLHFTWGGLFRVWQISRRDSLKLPPNQSPEPTPVTPSVPLSRLTS
jgi:hypothetical protein